MTRDDARDRLLLSLADGMLHLLSSSKLQGTTQHTALVENIRGFCGEMIRAAPHLRGRPADVSELGDR